MKKIIEDEYFNQLKNSAFTVPRYKKTGEVQSNFKVGSEYTIVNKKNKEEIKARCTQNCPYHLILINKT